MLSMSIPLGRGAENRHATTAHIPLNRGKEPCLYSTPCVFYLQANIYCSLSEHCRFTSRVTPPTCVIVSFTSGHSRLHYPAVLRGLSGTSALHTTYLGYIHSGLQLSLLTEEKRKSARLFLTPPSIAMWRQLSMFALSLIVHYERNN